MAETEPQSNEVNVPPTIGNVSPVPSTISPVLSNSPDVKRIDVLEQKLNSYQAEAELIKNGLQKAQQQTDNLKAIIVYIIATIAVSVFLITFDYLSFSWWRFDKFVDKVEDVRKSFYSKDEVDNIFLQKSEFYPKSSLDSLFIENTKNSSVLECFKIKQSFSVQCFNSI